MEVTRHATDNVVIVESPFQIICAYEFIKSKKIDKYVIVVRLGDNTKNNQQLQKVAKKLKMHNICYYKVTTNFGKFKFLLLIAKLIRKSKRVVIGDVNSFIYRALKPFLILFKEVVTLDDGTATIARKESNTSKVERFSMFDAAPQVNGANSFCNIRELLKLDNLPQKDIIIIIGSKLIEVGICSVAEYELFIESCLRIAKEQKLTPFYVSHRGEVDKNFDEVSKRMGVDIHKIDCELPIELFAIEYGYLPRLFVSTISTALFSLDSIYRNFIDIRYYQINEDTIVQRKDAILKIYDALSKNANILEIK